MGINLPARLVVIKSTQSYKGSMKGYQEYTRIEIDQMMGRAGRPPFDTEGTVVIMTEKANYNRYNSSLELENLESQLFSQMLEHLNAEISLGSISALDDVYEYIRNSFCYIRMKKSPAAYGINGNVD
jgi:replicative superfamily II helicase